ncbi:MULTISPECIES: LacI family DNA-binding transcriptional regulator [Streptomyces]|uniref:LacI family DNA-binding transcriptional regulator n=1 Tax=Streptomyces TaxID=1883 RepID=UPI001D04B6AB|nr:MULTISPECIES: substrate-binding domain-containing protein [Streptomyces]
MRGGALLAGPAGQAPAAGRHPRRTLGLLVPSASQVSPRVIAGVREVAARRGARLVVALTHDARPGDPEQLAELAAAGVRGLIVVGAEPHRLSAAVLGRLQAGELPFLLAEYRPWDEFAACECVVVHHRQGAFAAVRHLAAVGHRGVGLLTAGGATGALVREGHAEAVRRLGLVPGAPSVDLARDAVREKGRGEAYDRFLRACRGSGTRAALVHTDRDAIALLRRMRAHGLRAPDDLAVVAYGDEIASLADVPLTAVAPPQRELGRLAAHLLLDRLAAGDPSAVPVRQLALRPRLIVRASCGASGQVAG